METPKTRETVVATEIERKFLVTSLPEGINLAELKGKKINQGYLLTSSDGAVRIRRKGDSCFWTFKSAPGAHAAERIELETEITQDQFETMWPATAGKRVEKTRYEIPFGDNTIELDVFEGENAGWMLAEVEFVSTRSADLFQPPDWFGEDVTADNRYGNASIAETGFPT